MSVTLARSTIWPIAWSWVHQYGFIAALDENTGDL
jgi:hypothetical protein